jgi:cytochrome c biogenesis protein CcmG, thiol:disulfide interchange protein DsbE
MLKRSRLPAALLSLVLSAGCYSNSRPPHVGSPAKEFSVTDSDHTVNLNQYRGQVVLVNFWATWCPPCVEELPSLMTLQERMKGRGLVVVGVSIDVDGDAYHRFLKLHGINFVTVRDPDQKVAGMYGTSGWPETYIIDRQGVLRRKFVGPVDWNAPDVVAFLSRM